MSKELNSGLYGSKILSVLPLSLILYSAISLSFPFERTQVRPVFLYVQIYYSFLIIPFPQFQSEFYAPNQIYLFNHLLCPSSKGSSSKATKIQRIMVF